MQCMVVMQYAYTEHWIVALCVNTVHEKSAFFYLYAVREKSCIVVLYYTTTCCPVSGQIKAIQCFVYGMLHCV